MKQLLSIFFLIFFSLGFGFATEPYKDVESYQLCGQTYRFVSFTKNQKEIIETKIKAIYGNDICEKIKFQDLKFSLYDNHYIASLFFIDDNKTIILKDDKVIFSYINTEDTTIDQEVYISLNGAHFLYSPYFDFVDIEITKENIQQYADMIREQYPDVYGIFIDDKRVYDEFIFKSTIDFMYENNIFNHFHSGVGYKLPIDYLSESEMNILDTRLQLLAVDRKEKIQEKTRELLEHYEAEYLRDTDNFRAYRKWMLIDYIYSELKIEELKK